MCGWQHVAKWRPAKHDLAAIEIYPVGEVRPAAGDQLDRAQFTQVSKPGPGHPLGQPYRILYTGDAGNPLDTAGNVNATCHHAPRLALVSRAGPRALKPHAAMIPYRHSFGK